jgi:hypothetical protein
MRRTLFGSIAATAAMLAVTAGAATAAMSMKSELSASLSGMGDKGTATVTINTDSKQICWKLNLPMVKEITGAAIHTGMSGSTLLELGMHYSASGCETESAMTLDHVAMTPKSYYVWINTKGHPGDLRGQLHTGM